MELYDLEIHRKKLGPDNSRLKAKMKRSIEQEIRNKNSGNRNGNFEKNAVVKNQEHNRVYKKSWRLLAMGDQRAVCERRQLQFPPRHEQAWEKLHHQIRLRILSCSRMNENHREPEVPEAEVPVVECLDGLARITLEEFAITLYFSKKKWQNPECLFYKTKSGCRFGEKCSFAHRQVDEQPTKRSKMNDGRSAEAILKKGNWQERESVADWM